MASDSFIARFKKRPLSHSQLSSWFWDKEEWAQTYLDGKKFAPNKEMIFGSFIDNKIQKDPKFLPEIVRYRTLQYEMRVCFSGIYMVGYADAWQPNPAKLRDYKTGKKAWDQQRADETEQLTMYALMTYIQHKIKPEEIEFFIDWMQTEERGDFSIGFVPNMQIQTFKTRRTMKDILEFGVKIKSTVDEMEAYAIARKKRSELSTGTLAQAPHLR